MAVDNVKSADRVLRTLEHLCGQPDGLRAAPIGAALDIPISSCVALLGTMVKRGFVKLDDERAYSLTDKLRADGCRPNLGPSARGHRRSFGLNVTRRHQAHRGPTVIPSMPAERRH